MNPLQTTWKQRALHIAMLIIGVGIPVATVIQASVGGVQLGAGWSIGIVAAAAVAVMSNVKRFLPTPSDQEVSAINRALNVIGSLAASASAVLVLVLSSVPTAGKVGIVGATVAGLLTNLRVVAARGATSRDPSAGSIRYGLLWALVAAGLFALLAWPAFARAEQFGGCFAGGKVCAGPSAAITVASFNLATSQFSGGVSPGIGYGVTYGKAEWYAVGVDLYASLRLGQGVPNQAAFTLMGHFARYVFLGIGPTVTQREAGQSALVQWSILGGLGVPIGDAR
jgi:hypothetical protein